MLGSVRLFKARLSNALFGALWLYKALYGLLEVSMAL